MRILLVMLLGLILLLLAVIIIHSTKVSSSLPKGGRNGRGKRETNSTKGPGFRHRAHQSPTAALLQPCHELGEKRKQPARALNKYFVRGGVDIANHRSP